jgi:hypothetical protein
MTAEQCVAMLEGYYGEYPRPLVRRLVGEYLQAFTPMDTELLFRYVVATYSGQYRHTPDVAVLERAKEEINATRVSKIGRLREQMDLPLLPGPGAGGRATPEEVEAELAPLCEKLARRDSLGEVPGRTGKLEVPDDVF